MPINQLLHNIAACLALVFAVRPSLHLLLVGMRHASQKHCWQWLQFTETSCIYVDCSWAISLHFQRFHLSLKV